MPTNLWCAERGGDGLPVVCLHGQPGLGADFDAVSAQLCADHRVLAPDRPGYGRSGPEPTPIAENADGVAALLVGRGAAPAVVVGYSYGGAVAIVLADRYPELVSSLVLVASVGTRSSLGAFDRVMALPVVGDAVAIGGILAMGTVLARVGTQARRAGGRVATFVGTTLPDAHFARLDLDRARRVWRAVVAEQRNLVAEIDAVDGLLATLRLPVEVLAGEWDLIVPARATSELAARIPGAALTVVEGCGHFMPRDAPGAIASAVRRAARRAGTA